jgi:hypothetical protein
LRLSATDPSHLAVANAPYICLKYAYDRSRDPRADRVGLDSCNRNYSVRREEDSRAGTEFGSEYEAYDQRPVFWFGRVRAQRQSAAWPHRGPACAAATARELPKPCTLENLNFGFIDFYYLSHDRTSIGNQSDVQ